MIHWAIAIGLLIVCFVASIAWAAPRPWRRGERRRRGARGELLFFSHYAPRVRPPSAPEDPLAERKG